MNRGTFQATDTGPLLRSLRVRLHGWTLRCFLRLAEKDVVHGLPVGLLWPNDEDRRVILPKIIEAFELLARFDPRRLVRFQRDVSAVLVEHTSGSRAEWVSAVRLVRLEISHVRALGTSALEVASMLVHEGAHAWMDRLGIVYEEPERARIEAVCFRSELAFLRRVPGAEELMTVAERQLTRDPGYWTNAAFQSRQVTHLGELGVPGWFIRLLVWMRGRIR